ncbi:MAG: insulinase family protein [Luteibaculaceae bacterium]
MLRKLFVFLFFIPILGAEAQTIKRAEHFSLPSGLRVTLSENKAERDVFGALVVRSGGKDDPEHNTGMAHYLEHMLFKGSQQIGTLNFELEKVLLDSIAWEYEFYRSAKNKKDKQKHWDNISNLSVKASQFALPGEFDKLLSAFGSTGVNANTDFDATSYFNSFPADQIPAWLSLQKERFSNPVFRLFQSEMEVILEEKAMGDAEYVNQALEKFLPLVFKNHAYGKVNLIGSNEHLLYPSIKAMEQFYQLHYTAQNMHLILVGNFNAKETRALIEQELADFNLGAAPKKEKSKPKPFNQDKVTIRFAPVKLRAEMYRMPEKFSKQDAYLNLIALLLANENDNGLLDRQAKKGKFMFADALKTEFAEENLFISLYTPAWFLGSLKKAEKLFQAQLDSIKMGHFSPTFFEAVKNGIKLDFELTWLDNEDRGDLLMELAKSEHFLDDYLWYQAWMQSATKEDIAQFAQTFFGDNKLEITNRLGIPKKNRFKTKPIPKLETPRDTQSVYFKNFTEQIEKNPDTHYVDFTKLRVDSLSNGVTSYFFPNKLTKLCAFEFQHPFYQAENGLVNILSELELGFWKDRQFQPLSDRLQELGFSTAISITNSSVALSGIGLAEHLEEALSILNSFYEAPSFNPENLRETLRRERLERLTERFTSSSTFDAAFQYLNFKENSAYLTRPTKKQLRKTTPQDVASMLQAVFKEAPSFYLVSGQNQAKEMVSKLKFLQTDKTHLQAKYTLQAREETTLYRVKGRGKKQAQTIYFSVLDTVSPAKISELLVLNQYLNGGMQGLWFQELRELRSLAYSVSGRFTVSPNPWQNTYFSFFTITDAKKQVNFLQEFNRLKNEPLKPTELQQALESLQLNPAEFQPKWYELADYSVKWKNRGFATDPKQKIVEQFSSNDFELLNQQLKESLSNRDGFFLISGSKRKLKKAGLFKSYSVKELKRKNLFIK